MTPRTGLLCITVLLVAFSMGNGCPFVAPPGGQPAPGGDLCPNDPDKTEPGICGCGVADVDNDGDGIPDCTDPCPADPANACGDLCPGDPNKTAPGICGCGSPDTDTDGDGTPDCNDPCPADPADACGDLCPNDPNKTAPGTCGCGVPDTDTDGDGTPDCNDGCPGDINKVAPGACGCGVADIDSDGDGTLDCLDGCPTDINKVAPGVCGCNVPDVDSDGDGALDCVDGCPGDINKTAPGACGCGTPDTDSDLDGTADCNELVGTLYAVTAIQDNKNAFVSINTTTGALTVIKDNVAGVGTGIMPARTVDHAGHRFFFNLNDTGGTDRIRTIDIATGNYTDSSGDAGSFAVLAYDAGSGTLYAITSGAGKQFGTVNPATGVFTAIIAADAPYSNASAFDPANNRLFTIAQVSGTWRLRTFNTQTGAYTDSPETGYMLCLGYDWNTDALVGITSCCPNNFVRIDPTTGAVTVLADVSATGFADTGAIGPVAGKFYTCVDTGAGKYLRSIDVNTGAYTDSTGPTGRSMLRLGVD